MTCPLPNEGKIDRIVRLLAAFALIIIAARLSPGAGGDIAYALGAVSLLTALTGFCPAYKLLRIKTNH